jgi:hypothetical protein
LVSIIRCERENYLFGKYRPEILYSLSKKHQSELIHSKWWALPSHYGSWHSIYTRMSRWAKSGVLNAVF